MPANPDRIARKCETVLLKALDAFPALLAEADCEIAARIVADIIKAERSRPVPEPDPTAALTAALDRFRATALDDDTGPVPK